MTTRILIIGGGAAGYFGAAACADAAKEAGVDVSVQLVEGTRRPLTKVRISGGGRCNVTHSCFDPKALAASYPRGHRELVGPFSRFQPEDTLRWFAARGVAIKREDDGRMFPTTDDSETIARCLEQAVAKAGVDVRLGTIVKGIARGEAGGFVVTLQGGEERFDRILLATGSAPGGHGFAAALGHRIVPPVPSLFTFNVKDARLDELAGVSFPAVVLRLTPEAPPGGQSPTFEQKGPLLVTHWGLSGPGVLKLSAWAARELHASRYRATLEVCLLPGVTRAAVLDTFKIWRSEHGRRQIASESPWPIPRRYWQRLVQTVAANPVVTWAEADRGLQDRLADELLAARFQVDGKGVFKDEFVTAGGVALSEVNFRTLESRLVPGLHFAGEVLDIDGITGGFNFQNAWTTSYLAGRAMAGVS